MELRIATEPVLGLAGLHAPGRGPLTWWPCGGGPCRKDILQEYLEISSLVQEDVASIHRELAAAAARIQPEFEYLGFLRQYG